jgi:hypothetical protein
MSPRESNEVMMGDETGSVSVAVVDIGKCGVFFEAATAGYAPPSRTTGPSGAFGFECVLSVRTRSDSDAAYRSLARSAENRGGRTKLMLRKVTDGTAKVKECGRAAGARGR